MMSCRGYGIGIGVNNSDLVFVFKLNIFDMLLSYEHSFCDKHKNIPNINTDVLAKT